jgi:catechol 2,3-dioxygenase-like lactoylglutathione lyase family enzyme
VVDLSRATLLHASLAVGDLPAAARFFRDIFGFEVAFEAAGMTHQIARMTGRAGLACDLMQLTRPGDGTGLELIAFRPSPLADAPDVPAAHVAFAVPDLDEALRQATGAGAKLLGEVVEFSEGRSAYVRVPGGATNELEEMIEEVTA